MVSQSCLLRRISLSLAIMAAPHSKKRPHDADWPEPDLRRRNYGATPGIQNSISSRLWRALRGKDAAWAYRVTQFLRGMPWEVPGDEWTPEEGSEWKAWRYLGAGGQGTAAVWVKKDKEGKTLDEIVLKEQCRGFGGVHLYNNQPHLSTEAVLQNHTNLGDCESKFLDFYCSANIVCGANLQP